MSGPLNGIGGGQVPFATTFQPGQTSSGQVREDRQPKQDQIQPQGFQPSQSQGTETRNADARQSLLNRESSPDSGGRGKLLDITV